MDKCIPSYKDNPYYSQQLFQSVVERLNHYNIIFTDGSKHNDEGGCGFYDSLQKDYRLFYLDNRCIVFPA